jgi:hypothetical protein
MAAMPAIPGRVQQSECACLPAMCQMNSATCVREQQKSCLTTIKLEITSQHGHKNFQIKACREKRRELLEEEGGYTAGALRGPYVLTHAFLNNCMSLTLYFAEIQVIFIKHVSTNEAAVVH